MSAPPRPVTIRAARPADVPLVLAFIRELAVYERLEDQVVATAADLATALFGPRPLRGSAARLPRRASRSGSRCSSTISRPSSASPASTWRTCSCARRRGAPASAASCSRTWPGSRSSAAAARLDWAVLDWNEPSIGFYRSLGAATLDDWTTFRLSGDALARLARGDRAPAP